MKTMLKNLCLMTACLAAAPALAQEYRVPHPLHTQVLQIDRQRFSLESVNPAGNLCSLEGRFQGRGQHRFYEDGQGCRVEFVLDGKQVEVSIPEGSASACRRQYCGHNAYMEGSYERLPAACSLRGQQRMEARFQAAYRARRFNEAAQIKNHWFGRCESFSHLITQMRTRNDLAAAYKNAGNNAACRAALQPWREEIESSSDAEEFAPTPLLAEDYTRELKAARFNWQACR